MKKRRILTALICAITATTMAFNTSSGIFADEKEPVEIISMRSQYEKHYDNGNGTTTAFINTAPLHYYENSQWCEIDNSLEINESGDYVNKSNSMDITLASSASPKTANTIGNDQMVKLEYDGYTISWDMLNTQQNSNHISASSTVQLVTKDSAEDVNFTLGGENLTEKASACLDKLNSSVVYDSIFEDVDVALDILPSSIKETIILNDNDSVPEQFAYYITADGLDAELQADNSIEFTNEQDEVIFKMPAMFMFDSSSEIPEYNYDIETAIVPIKNGYLLTITPDSEWLNSDDRVYPVMIDPEVSINTINNMDSFYISEAAPNSITRDTYIKMSDMTNNHYQSYISFPDAFTSYGTQATIVDAKLYLYFRPHDKASDKIIKIYSNNIEPINPCWSNDSVLDANNTYISSFIIPSNSSFAWYSADITSLAQAWLNYANTSQWVIGVPNYGFKLVSEEDTNSTVNAYSSNANYNKPYFEITYTISSNYRLEYANYKYNDISNNSTGSIYNFQKRMNCYAYALQTYYRGTLTEGEAYYLKPGEFGISFNSNISDYSELCTQYNTYNEKGYKPYMDFVEQRMYNDATALGFEISKIENIIDSFELPTAYNQNTERIIAMVVGSSKGIKDYHFYVRNGNGTCTNGHGGNCSMWSHKQSYKTISNTMINSTIVLCDDNIFDNANAGIYSNYNKGGEDDSTVRFYTITQDANLYNSWHKYGHDDNSAGTPYLSLT